MRGPDPVATHSPEGIALVLLVLLGLRRENDIHHFKGARFETVLRLKLVSGDASRAENILGNTP